MAGRVAGKVAVITGGARGIGYGCAAKLAGEGAQVVIGDILEAEGEGAAAAIREAGGQAIFQRTDVRDEQQCAALIEAAGREFGRLNILVNNVGWFPRAGLEDTTTEFWENTIQINLRSAFFCCKFGVPRLRAAGGGSIINIGSINGIQGLPTLVAYSAAKGGLLAMTRTLAGAYAPDRIRVNYVIPGWVLSEGELELHRTLGLDEQAVRHAGEHLALGRHQTPDDTANAVLFLASDESSQITGTIMHIDAGASTLPVRGHIG